MACATFPHLFRLPAPRLAVQHAVFGIRKGAGRGDVALSGLCLRCQPRSARGGVSGRPGLRVSGFPHPFCLPAPRLAVRNAVFGAGRGARRGDVALSGLRLRCQPHSARGGASGRPGLRVSGFSHLFCVRAPRLAVRHAVFGIRKGAGRGYVAQSGCACDVSRAAREGVRRGGPDCAWAASRTLSVFPHPDLPCGTPRLGAEGVREGAASRRGIRVIGLQSGRNCRLLSGTCC